MLTNRAFLLWCCGAFLAAAGRADAEGTRAAAEFDWGVLGGRFEDANGDTRTRALGPFFERIVSPRGERFRAARPFYCALERPSESRRHAEYLWPLAVSRDFQKEHSLRVLLAYYRNFDVEDPNPRYHVRILPFYFQGRDIRGRSYKALFPLGGRIHEFLGQDEMSFFLFPLWSYSSINSVQTHSVLWPVYSRTRGKGISRFRVFPFYGYARHRARFEKGFVAWPFYTWARYTYPDDQGRGYIVFPLWGRFVMPDQRAWLILPPLFRFSRGERLNYSYAPWPFVQASSGEIEKRYLWPLWGRRSLRGIGVAVSDQQQFHGVLGEAPIIIRHLVDCDHERRACDERSPGPENAPNLLYRHPGPGHVLQDLVEHDKVVHICRVRR